jgi:hypothetical protein
LATGPFRRRNARLPLSRMPMETWYVLNFSAAVLLQGIAPVVFHL